MKSKCKIQLMMLAVLFMVTIPFSAYGADGQIKIGQTASTTFPIVIDKPGSYVLTSNIVVSTAANGIEINSDHVTLDLNGFAVIGSRISPSNGIRSSNKKNIAVTNGTVRDFGDNGIWLTGTNSQIKDIRAFNNGVNGGLGILTSASGSIIATCVASGNSIGISADFSTIDNCTVVYNYREGIITTACIITKCLISFNGSAGIFLQSGMTGGSIVTNCNILSNGWHGIRATDTPNGEHCIKGNNLRGNGRTDPGGWGIYIMNNRNYVIQNSASSNASGNFYVADPATNYVPTTGDNANIGW